MRRFGSWTVLHEAPRHGRLRYWTCRCVCGTERDVFQGDLRRGRSTGCGRRVCGSGRGVRGSNHAAFGKRGSESRTWKGGGVTYSGAHERVKAHRGKAREHNCVDCSTTAEDWSYVGGAPDERVQNGLAYSPSPEFYVPRCKLCHMAHDKCGVVA